MIQETFIAFKRFFNSSSFDFTSPISLDEFNRLETYLLNNIDSSSSHVHDFIECHSCRLKVYSYYDRNYVTFEDGHIVNKLCTIPVLYCENDMHYHALLPAPVFIPHFQYTLSFVLSVLYDKLYVQLKVEEITEKYELSIATLYRWIHRYRIYLRMYLSIRSSLELKLIIALKDNFIEIVNDFYNSFLCSPFQYNRKLFDTLSG